jgi:hypothetical protein
MRVDRVLVGETLHSIINVVRRILHAFDNNITVQDNFGPSGAPEGHIIVSRGPLKVPEWRGSGDLPATVVEALRGEKGDTGDTGPAGEQGPQGEAALALTGYYEVQCDPDIGTVLTAFDSFGNLVVLTAWVEE